MGAKTEALRDIKEYLDLQANDDKIVRRNEGKRWRMYLDAYVWDGSSDSYSLRVSHIVGHKKYFNNSIN